MKVRKRNAAFLLAALFSFGCNDGGTGPQDGAEFSNLSGISAGATYVAYTSPDPATKPDIVQFGFTCNPSKVSSIVVRATLDSGRNWIVAARPLPGSDGKVTVSWVPKDAAQSTFNYFGFRQCYLRIEDTVSGAFITSDTFRIIGALPIALISPLGGETFGKDDSLTVVYGQNQDLTGNITVCGRAAPDTVDFVRDIGTKVRTSQELPIKNWTATFIPQELAAAQPESFDFTFPIVILLVDYGPNGKRVSSGAITIE